MPTCCCSRQEASLATSILRTTAALMCRSYRSQEPCQWRHGFNREGGTKTSHPSLPNIAKIVSAISSAQQVAPIDHPPSLGTARGRAITVSSYSCRQSYWQGLEGHNGRDYLPNLHRCSSAEVQLTVRPPLPPIYLLGVSNTLGGSQNRGRSGLLILLAPVRRQHTQKKREQIQLARPRGEVAYSSSFASPDTRSDAPACLAAARLEYHASNCFLVIFLRSSLGKDRRSDHARSSDSKMERACIPVR